MIKLNKRYEELVISFPKIRGDVQLTIRFQRTHRIPDDGLTYPQLPEIEQFPLHDVDKYLEKVPGRWLEHGGVMVPMYQGEGVWIEFESKNITEYGRPFPFAVKIASGEINAVTGNEWTGSLDCDAQDYVVVPGQSRIDGFNVQQGLVRQFVAMPLGQGYSVEEQLREGPAIGGIQIMVYPMSREAFTRQKDPPGVFPQFSPEDLDVPGPTEAPPEQVEEPAAADMSANDILAAAFGDEGGAAESVSEKETAGEEDASEADEESPPPEGKVWLGLLVVLGIVLGFVVAFNLKPIFWLTLGLVFLGVVFWLAFLRKKEKNFNLGSPLMFIRIRGKVYGPYDKEKLRLLAQRGQISRVTPISEDGVNWKPCRDVGDSIFAPQGPQNNPLQSAANVFDANAFRTLTEAIEESQTRTNQAKRDNEIAQFEIRRLALEQQQAAAEEQNRGLVNQNLNRMVDLDSVPPKLSLVAGGRIHQQIFADTYSPTDWDTSTCRGCFVHLVNSELWYHLTGNAPPRKPLTAKEYNDAGLPWLDSYQEKTVVGGSKTLEGTKGVPYLPNNEPIAIKRVEKIRSEMEETQVREISIS